MTRQVATMTYWSGDIEVENVRFVAADVLGFEAPVKLPRVSYVGDGGKPVVQVGTVKGETRRLVLGGHPRLGGWPVEAWKPVTRHIRVLTTANPHVCDWRCLGAAPQGDCRCECGGRNHGRDFTCDLVA